MLSGLGGIFQGKGKENQKEHWKIQSRKKVGGGRATCVASKTIPERNGKNIHHLSKHFPPYQQAYQMVLLQTLLSPLLRLTRKAVLMSSNISPRTKNCKGSGDSFQRKARGSGAKFFLPLTYNLRQIPRPLWPWLPNLFFWRVRVST